MAQASLRLKDLTTVSKESAGKLVNVKVPTDLLSAVAKMSKSLGCTKTAAVVALLNEGLDVFDKQASDLPLKSNRKRRGRPTNGKSHAKRKRVKSKKKT